MHSISSVNLQVSTTKTQSDLFESASIQQRCLVWGQCFCPWLRLLRLSQSDQRCCNWHWLSVSSISTSSRQILLLLLPPKPLTCPQAPLGPPHLQRCHIHDLYPGILRLHGRGRPTSFDHCLLALVTHTHTHCSVVNSKIYQKCTEMNSGLFQFLFPFLLGAAVSYSFKDKTKGLQRHVV